MLVYNLLHKKTGYDLLGDSVITGLQPISSAYISSISQR